MDSKAFRAATFRGEATGCERHQGLVTQVQHFKHLHEAPWSQCCSSVLL